MARPLATDAGPAPKLRGGVDLGGTKIQALVINEAHAVLGRGREETPREGGPEAVVAALVDTMQAALKDAGAEAGELSGIGVGTPGAVDTVNGTVANARNLPNWIDPFPLAPKLSRALADVPVRLGNDVNVAIAGEYALGAGRGHDSILGVWWRAVQDEDVLALHAVERALKALGAGIASAVNLLDIPAVVIGGGMGERFFATHGAQLGQYMHENLFRAGDPPELLATELGDDGGAVGASLLVN